MIPLIDHHLWWGRSEVVIIFTQIYLWLTNKHHCLCTIPRYHRLTIWVVQGEASQRTARGGSDALKAWWRKASDAWEFGIEWFWLVVDLPLWKIWKSNGMMIPNIWKFIKFMFQSPPTRTVMHHKFRCPRDLSIDTCSAARNASPGSSWRPQLERGVPTCRSRDQTSIHGDSGKNHHL